MSGKRRLRRISALILATMMIGFLFWVAFVGFTEERVSYWLERSIYADTLKYRVVLESFDPNAGVMQARAYLTYNRLGLIGKDKELNRQILDLPDTWQSHQSLKIFFGPFVFDDLADKFSVIGICALRETRKQAPPAKPLPSYSESLPGPRHLELITLGNPRSYPFDKYLMVARVDCDVLLTLDGKSFARLESLGPEYEIELRAPGLSLRNASREELRSWPTIWARVSEGAKNENVPGIGPTNQFALILERPLFLQILTIVLGVSAIVFVLASVFASRTKLFFVNATAYFLALWAIRDVLSSGGPSTPTVIDYSVLALYILMITAILARMLWGRRRTPSSD